MHLLAKYYAGIGQLKSPFRWRRWLPVPLTALPRQWIGGYSIAALPGGVAFPDCGTAPMPVVKTGCIRPHKHSGYRSDRPNRAPGAKAAEGAAVEHLAASPASS
jgi:hypothetical protein